MQVLRRPSEPATKFVRVLIVVVVTGIGTLGVLAYVKTQKLREPIPQLEAPKSVVPDIPGTCYLRTAPIPENEQVHLLDGDFQIVKKVNEIPNRCMLTFASSFVTISGVRAEPEKLLANPGEPFQESDDIRQGLPFRRLEFAGLADDKCFIYYQSGGQPRTFCLAVLRFADNKAVCGGKIYKQVANLSDLRRVIRELSDASGHGC